MGKRTVCFWRYLEVLPTATAGQHPIVLLYRSERRQEAPFYSHLSPECSLSLALDLREHRGDERGLAWCEWQRNEDAEAQVEPAEQEPGRQTWPGSSHRTSHESKPQPAIPGMVGGGPGKVLPLTAKVTTGLGSLSSSRG